MTDHNKEHMSEKYEEAKNTVSEKYEEAKRKLNEKIDEYKERMDGDETEDDEDEYTGGEYPSNMGATGLPPADEPDENPDAMKEPGTS